MHLSIIAPQNAGQTTGTNENHLAAVEKVDADFIPIVVKTFGVLVGQWRLRDS